MPQKERKKTLFSNGNIEELEHINININRKRDISTSIVITSAVLSLFNSSSIELSDEKASVKFFDCAIGNNSSYNKGHS
jgi:hypothetical protein